MKKALAMKCTQEQWDSIKGRIPEDRIQGVCNFTEYPYLANNFNEKGIISNTGKNNSYPYEIHETFNAKTFLDACGIDCDDEIEELWLPVHNYYGFYEVSNMGNVRSLSREVKHSKNPKFTKKVYGRLLSKSLNPQGYNKVRLSMYGVKTTHLVYHLVSEVFHGHINRSDFICVDHIDEDKTNDKASNFQIISKQENTKKSFDYKLEQFKEGEYWFHSTGSLVLIFEITKKHGGTIKCKHIDNDSENFAFHGISCMDRKATPQEIEAALIYECEKLGLVDGAHYLSLNKDFKRVLKYPLRLFDECIIDDKKNVIFDNGIFAQIIEIITIQEA